MDKLQCLVSWRAIDLEDGGYEGVVVRAAMVILLLRVLEMCFDLPDLGVVSVISRRSPDPRFVVITAWVGDGDAEN